MCSNQGDESSMGVEDKNNRITSKTNKLETRHLKLHEKTLEIKEIELKLKEEQQTENQQQLKEDDTKNLKKKTEISSQMNKPKEIKTLEKNDEREDSRYVETCVECGSCYRWYHYKWAGTTEKEIMKLYLEKTYYICKKDQNSESIINWKNQYDLKQKEVETLRKKQ